jgi:hypothetical protein
MSLRLGDIFWISVTYPKTGETEVRPVVIYDFDEDIPVIVSFAAITSSKIIDFDGKFDKWKVPIFRYREAGLDYSFVKANCIATVDKSAFKPSNYIGNMDKLDLKNVKNRIAEFLESGDEFW